MISALTETSYMTLAGVVVGAVAGTLGNLVLERRRRVLESKRLAYALRGEIAALSAIVRKRGHAERIESVISQMEQDGSALWIAWPVRREYFNVFKTNVNNIGCLKNPLPEHVSRFYTQATALLDDFQALEVGGVWRQASQDALLEFYKDLLAMFKDTFSLAEEIVA